MVKVKLPSKSIHENKRTKQLSMTFPSRLRKIIDFDKKKKYEVTIKPVK